MASNLVLQLAMASNLVAVDLCLKKAKSLRKSFRSPLRRPAAHADPIWSDLRDAPDANDDSENKEEGIAGIAQNDEPRPQLRQNAL